ncbi:MAG: DUF3192 domain-containing protein [Enterobacterales bacterium]|nr:DUF3192 domain-containing protein [Enterobacterales bacterium]
MKHFTSGLAALLLLVSLSGCIVVGGDSWRDDEHWKQRQSQNRETIAALELGATRQSIVSQLGAPDLSEAFSRGQDQFRVLYYRTSHKHSDGNTTKDETTPLIFKNDLLVGWGNEALSSYH